MFDEFDIKADVLKKILEGIQDKEADKLRGLVKVSIIEPSEKSIEKESISMDSDDEDIEEIDPDSDLMKLKKLVKKKG